MPGASARNAKPRWVQHGTIGTTAPRRLTQFAHSAKKLGTTRSDAQRSRVLHAVVERTDFGRTFECPEHILHSVRRKRSQSHALPRQ